MSNDTKSVNSSRSYVMLGKKKGDIMSECVNSSLKLCDIRQSECDIKQSECDIRQNDLKQAIITFRT